LCSIGVVTKRRKQYFRRFVILYMTMRLKLLLLILIATFFGSTYWYTLFDTVCNIPIQYHVGAIDTRFGTSKEEVIRIAKNAENIWESKIGKDLFVYSESEGLPINFVFDDRQKDSVLAEELRQDIIQKEGMSESVSAQYEKLISEFRGLKKAYESNVVLYEEKLSSYNTEVNEWNKKGGAPDEVIAQLELVEKSLTQNRSELEARAKKINQLVNELNAIGARGNSLITDYNTIVGDYNNRFSDAKEFTQGDYTGKAIDIYQFNTEDELTIVLAHEFGHALSIDHVDNARSIMYYFMKEQRIANGLSPEDIAEFSVVCSSQSGFERLVRAMKEMFVLFVF